MTLELVRFGANSAYAPLSGMIGEHPLMREVFRMVRVVASTEVPVAIVGETGTGKELVARSLHDLSRRSRGPFVAVNVAAVPAALFESELFGHEEGAFSDARKAKPGLIEVAQTGTLFLDELTPLADQCQAKLLRVVEEGGVRRVGGVTLRRAAPRWIVSCQGFASGSRTGCGVREDLWHRVSGAIISLPPLRKRVSDIPALVAHFLALVGVDANRLADDVLEVLTSAPWRGNVRELKQAVQRLVLTADGGRITAAMASAEVCGTPISSLPGRPDRQELLSVLTEHCWNLKHVAAHYHVARGTLYRWIHGAGLERPLKTELSRMFNEHVQDT